MAARVEAPLRSNKFKTEWFIDAFAGHWKKAVELVEYIKRKLVECAVCATLLHQMDQFRSNISRIEISSPHHRFADSRDTMTVTS